MATVFQGTQQIGCPKRTSSECFSCLSTQADWMTLSWGFCGGHVISCRIHICLVTQDSCLWFVKCSRMHLRPIRCLADDILWSMRINSGHYVSAIDMYPASSHTEHFAFSLKTSPTDANIGWTLRCRCGNWWLCGFSSLRSSLLTSRNGVHICTHMTSLKALDSKRYSVSTCGVWAMCYAKTVVKAQDD